MLEFFRCPNCGFHGQLAGAGIDSRQMLEAPALKQRREAGRARARTASRTAKGTFRSEDEAKRLRDEFLGWLYEKPGRAGGWNRAATAKRTAEGKFAREPELGRWSGTGQR